jgi:hypothetical protein
MNENMGTPPTDASANRNRTYLIIAAVVLVLCCCCVVIGALGWQFGDQIMMELGLY